MAPTASGPRGFFKTSGRGVPAAGRQVEHVDWLLPSRGGAGRALRRSEERARAAALSLRREDRLGRGPKTFRHLQSSRRPSARGAFPARAPAPPQPGLWTRLPRGLDQL